MKTHFTSILVLVALSLVAAPAPATIYFYDNFDADTDGTLTGQTANSGQTWAAPVVSGLTASLDVSASYGSSGKGAGSTITKANLITFGDTSGVIDVWADFIMAGNNGPQYFLDDEDVPGNQGTFGIYNSHQTGMMGTENLGLAHEWATGMPIDTPGILRTKLTVDLDARTINIEWWGLGSNSGVHGTHSIGTYAPAAGTFLPNRLEITTSAPNGNQGYDNLFIATGGTVPPFIPEPSTLTLSVIGLVGTVCCSRRKRK